MRNEKTVIVGTVNIISYTDLFDVGNTCHISCPITGFSEGREQHSCKNCDDGDYDEKFDQSEFCVFHVFLLYWFINKVLRDMNIEFITVSGVFLPLIPAIRALPSSIPIFSALALMVEIFGASVLEV